MNYYIERNGEKVLNIRPDGQQVKKIMDVDQVELSFTDNEVFHFQLGDSILVYGQWYYLIDTIPEANKISSTQYEYNCTFFSQKYYLACANYLFLGSDNQLRETEFAFTGTAEKFLDLLLASLVVEGQTGWNKGVVTTTNTNTKNLTFSGENCLSVLARLAQEFETEYWIDNQTIHLTKRAPVTNITLEYGDEKGILKLQRTQINKPITRLYVYGGTRNLPPGYRNFAARLKLPLDKGDYLEKNPGLSPIPLTAVKKFDEIFPQRIGKVTHEIDPFRFRDTTLDFNVNAQLLPELSAKVVFQTGQLAGYEFELSKNGGYNHLTKTFTILKNEAETALPVPSELLRAAIGDEYILVDIKMPDSYVTNAELDLEALAQQYLDAESVAKFQYVPEIDYMFFKKRGIKLELGAYINLKDDDLNFNINPRVAGYSRDLQDKYQYSNLELAEKVELPAIVRRQTEARRFTSRPYSEAARAEIIRRTLPRR